MTDEQPKLRAHEYVLREILSTEVAFANSMAFLAGLRPEIDAALKGDLNKKPTQEMVVHQIALLSFLDKIDSIQKSSVQVIELFSQAEEMAKKIETGAVSPEEIAAHKANLKTALELHLKNISNAAIFFKQFNIEDYFNAEKNPLPLNQFVEGLIKQKQAAGQTIFGEINSLIIMPVQRIPRYGLLARDLETHLKNIPGVSSEQVAISSELANQAGVNLNLDVSKAQRKNVFNAFKKIINNQNKISEQEFKYAERELKSLIEEGGDLSKTLQEKHIKLGNLLIKMAKVRKFEPVTLMSPQEAQIGQVAANVISGYVQSGIPIVFDESAKASTLWKENLRKKQPNDNPAPILIDLPEGRLKNSSQIRQVVNTANMLREKGFEVQTSPRLKEAVKNHQNKSYGFFNIAAKFRQWAFKQQAKSFLSLDTFKPTPAPRTNTLNIKLTDLEQEAQASKSSSGAEIPPPSPTVLASSGKKRSVKPNTPPPAHDKKAKLKSNKGPRPSS